MRPGFRVLRGAQYVAPNGSLLFSPTFISPDGFYRTLFGPVFSHTGVMYANTPENLQKATTRLLCKVAPEIPGLHDTLMANQALFRQTHVHIFEELATRYLPYFEHFTTPSEQMEDHYADPHEKKELRIQAHDELHTEGKAADSNINWLPRNCKWKLKTQEWAKPGKYPRAIVDLTVPASLYGFRLFECFKQAQAHEDIYYKGGLIRFIKSPDAHTLKEAFDLLITCPYRFVYIYFSDDACLSIRVGQKIWFFNLDISSCDASHSKAIFRNLLSATPHNVRRYMKLLMKQCKSRLKVVNPSRPSEFVIFKLLIYCLLSGWTGTTAINGIANTTIALAIADADIQQPADIAAAARIAGYVITGGEAPLSKPEQLQFLKHSPMKDINDVYHPFLNLGVLLRAFGTCKGDLPGRGPLPVRGAAFQRGLLNGAYPRSTCSLLEAAWHAVGQGESFVTDVFERKVVESDYPHFRVTDQSICDRYDMTTSEYHELCYLVSTASFGTSINCPAANTILFLDYGLGTGFDTLPYIQPRHP